jgi:hypothetical protein
MRGMICCGTESGIEPPAHTKPYGAALPIVPLFSASHENEPNIQDTSCGGSSARWLHRDNLNY